MDNVKVRVTICKILVGIIAFLVVCPLSGPLLTAQQEAEPLPTPTRMPTTRPTDTPTPVPTSTPTNTPLPPSCTASAVRIGNTDQCNITVNSTGGPVRHLDLWWDNGGTAWTTPISQPMTWSGSGVQTFQLPCSRTQSHNFHPWLLGSNATWISCPAPIVPLIPPAVCGLSVTRSGNTDKCNLAVASKGGPVSSLTVGYHDGVNWSKPNPIEGRVVNWSGPTSENIPMNCSPTMTSTFSLWLVGGDGAGVNCIATVEPIPPAVCELSAERIMSPNGVGYTDDCAVTAKSTGGPVTNVTIGQSDGVAWKVPNPIDNLPVQWNAPSTKTYPMKCPRDLTTTFSLWLTGADGIGANCIQTVSRIPPANCGLSIQRVGNTGECRVSVKSSGGPVTHLKIGYWDGVSPTWARDPVDEYVNWTGNETVEKPLPCAIASTSTFSLWLMGADGKAVNCIENAPPAGLTACQVSASRIGNTGKCSLSVSSNGRAVKRIVIDRSSDTVASTNVFDTVNWTGLIPEQDCTTLENSNFNVRLQGVDDSWISCNAKVDRVPPAVCGLSVERDTNNPQTCRLSIKSSGGPVTRLTIGYNPRLGGPWGPNLVDENVNWSGNTSVTRDLACSTATESRFSLWLTGADGVGVNCLSTVSPLCVYAYKFTTGGSTDLVKPVATPTGNQLSQCLQSNLGLCRQDMDSVTSLLDPYCVADEFDGNNINICKTHKFRDCMYGKLKKDAGGAWLELYPTLLLDSECKLIGSIKHSARETRLNLTPTRILGSTEYRVCGTTEWLANTSPISLIFEEDVDINREQSVVSFPINPGVSGKLFTWKGSSQAPLLVYDPSHTGKITAASQLFGNWTFGGKRFVSLAPGAETQWRDGYEALASLDVDQDGKVSGRELEGLALWFDENRNAISEPGEVQSLEQHGVVELFFEVDQRDESRHTITATRGFTRLVNGKRVIGRSVDWYAEAADSLQALLGSLTPDRLATGVDNNGQKEESRESALTPEGLDGNWSWHAEEQRGDTQSADTPGGTLIMSQVGDNRLMVFSMSTRGFKSVSSGKDLLGLTMVDMVGEIHRVNQGEVEIEFETTKDVPGVKLRSKAKLTENGTTLRGYTVASGKDSNGDDKTLRYSWVAVKSNNGAKQTSPKK